MLAIIAAMKNLHDWISDAGGALRKRDLVALGARDRDLTEAVRSGHVRRARRGWYSTFHEDDPRFIALRVGGRLTGAAALALLGAWMWDHSPPPTVSVPANASRLRLQRGVTVVYDPPSVCSRGTPSTVDPRDALLLGMLRTSFEGAVALWDWANTSGIFSRDALDEVSAMLPANARGILTWANEGSDSILETSARVRFVGLGHDVECQVAVRGASAIDLVIDGTVALELDGETFHGHRFEHDRLKDLAIARAGWQPLRASYRMVRERWTEIELAVSTALAQHLPRLPLRTRPCAPSPVTHLTPGRRRRWRCGIRFR